MNKRFLLNISNHKDKEKYNISLSHSGSKEMGVKMSVFLQTPYTTLHRWTGTLFLFLRQSLTVAQAQVKWHYLGSLQPPPQPPK